MLMRVYWLYRELRLPEVTGQKGLLKSQFRCHLTQNTSGSCYQAITWYEPELKDDAVSGEMSQWSLFWAL